jgi:uroporphyrin-3 C-methyltransferase
MPDSTEPAPHTHRVTLLIALVGVVLAGYSLWRVDNTSNREDATRDSLQQFQTAQATLRAELNAATEREEKWHAELQKQWQQLMELPQQVKDLAAAHEDLRARTERPQRAWTRAEALYLIELAERRLSFDRDTATAIAALESADARLASLREASLSGVRERIVKDLQALKAVPVPDRVGVATRLAAVESQVDNLPLKGIIVGQRTETAAADESPSIFGKAWNAITDAVDRMFVVRRVDAAHGSVVSLEEQVLRREHLKLLLFSARSATQRSDQAAYRTALDAAKSGLAQYFNESPSVSGATREVEALAAINISPPLPDISGTEQLLARVMSSSQAP